MNFKYVRDNGSYSKWENKMVSSLEYRSHEHSGGAEPIRPNAALFKFVMPGLNNGLGDAGVWYGYIGKLDVQG